MIIMNSDSHRLSWAGCRNVRGGKRSCKSRKIRSVWTVSFSVSRTPCNRKRKNVCAKSEQKIIGGHSKWKENFSKTFLLCAVCRPVWKNDWLKFVELAQWTVWYATNRQIRQLSAFIEIVSGVRIFFTRCIWRQKQAQFIKKSHEHIGRSCCSHQDANIACVFEPGQLLAKNGKSISKEILKMSTNHLKCETIVFSFSNNFRHLLVTK